MSDRCYGCRCHRSICKTCGGIDVGAHFCPGRPTVIDPRWELGRQEDLRALAMLTLPPKCEIHRRYGAKMRPRTACEACWRLWIALHPA